MSWLNGLAEEKDILNQVQALEFTSDKPAPGFWHNFGGALADSSELGSISGWNSLKSSFVQLAGTEFASTLATGFGAGYTPGFDQELHAEQAAKGADELADEIGQDTASAAKALRPNATTTGMAGQLLSGLAEVVPRYAIASVAGGPVVGAFAAGAPQGYTATQVAKSEGIDDSTAIGQGLIEGAATTIGALIPGARIFKSIPGDLAAITGANVGLGMAGRGATAALLESNGYTAQAAQYRAFDKTAMLADGLLGLVFGGIGRAGDIRSAIGRRPTTDQINAALTERNAQHFDVDTAPGAPINPRSAVAHQKALTQAADQLNRGEPVSIPDDLEGAAFVRKDPAGPINDGLRAVADDVARADARAVGDDFAARVGRAAEYDDAGAPVFRDGTAYPLSEVSRFFDQFVATRQAKDGALMPDVLFQVGRVDDATAQGLRDYLSGFNENLREARISARVIKHIQDSRPSIVRDVLDRLERGVLQADEVLPNQKDPKRVMLVLRDTDAQGSQARHQSTVIELSANGKGVDVVSAMTMPDRTLNKARAYKQELDMSRTGGPLPPSSLGGRETQQPHAAAASEDFLAVERDSTSIDKPAAGTTAADPVVQVADEIMARAEDIQLPTGAIDADGNPVTVSAKQMMAEADADIVRADQDSKGFAAAAACFLQRGFK